MTVADTSFVFALVNRAEAEHAAALDWYSRQRDALVTTPLAIAELDHLVRRWGREAAVRAVYAQLESGGLDTVWWDEALDTTLRVVRARPDVGLVDASLVALAAHKRTTRIATFDERHFRSFAPLTGEPAFTLLPADAD